MKRKWTKQSLKKALFSVGGRALALLLCLCSALSFCLPANALSSGSAEYTRWFVGFNYVDPLTQTRRSVNSDYYLNNLGFNGANAPTGFCFQSSSTYNALPYRQYFYMTFSVNYDSPGVYNTGMQVYSDPISGWTTTFVVQNDTVSAVEYGKGIHYVHNVVGYIPENHAYTNLCFQGNMIGAQLFDTAQITYPIVNVSRITMSYVDSEESAIASQLSAIQSAINTQGAKIDTSNQWLENINGKLYNIQQYTNWTNADVYAIRGMISDLQTNGISSINNNIIAQGQATQNAINAQTEQQEEQYEQEKQEESDREEQGFDSNDEASNVFGFSVSNPFDPLFAMFSTSNCVSIPTIASLLNAPSSEYCSWFPLSIRQVLTPVLSISAMMLLFGFFIRWLSGTSGEASSGYVQEKLTERDTDKLWGKG